MIAPSLLLIGFPKGFTSQAWQIIVRAVPFEHPGVGDGEVLNHQRIERGRSAWLRDYVRRAGRINDGFYSKSEAFYPHAEAILDHFSNGSYCVKDVVQPFFVMRFLLERSSAYRVLFCNRPLDEVRERHRNAGWHYAQDMDAVREVYSSFPSFNVHNALYDSNTIFDALEQLGYKVKRFDYIDQQFIRKRDALYCNGVYRHADRPYV